MSFLNRALLLLFLVSLVTKTSCKRCGYVPVSLRKCAEVLREGQLNGRVPRGCCTELKVARLFEYFLNLTTVCECAHLSIEDIVPNIPSPPPSPTPIPYSPPSPPSGPTPIPYPPPSSPSGPTPIPYPPPSPTPSPSPTPIRSPSPSHCLVAEANAAQDTASEQLQTACGVNVRFDLYPTAPCP